MGTIPPKVRIGHFTFSLAFMDKGSAKAAAAFGWTENGMLQIRVEEGLADSLTADTLIHELIHAMYFAYCWPKEGMTEEQVSSVMPGAWLRLWMDNPELTEWFGSLSL
jgi:hypothetical protein